MSVATPPTLYAAFRVDGLTAGEQDMLATMLAKLQRKETRNRLRTKYYEAKNELVDLGISIPPALRTVETVLGWPAKAVDVLARRCKLDGFVLPGASTEDLGIDAMLRANRFGIEVPQALTSSLVHSCAFVAVTLGDTGAGEPKVLITARSARSGTGVWDPRRRMLRAALSVIEWTDKAVSLVMYLPDVVITMNRDDGGAWDVRRTPHRLGRVPVRLLPFKPLLDRPFGTSRISRPVMALTDSAVRTLLRTEVTAEFYSAPQRWVMGASQADFVNDKGEQVGQWDSLLGHILALPRDEDTGEIAQVGQFAQQTMQPHTDQLRSLATLFAGETNLPLSSLGIVQDNPASAEAIYAGKEDLLVEAEAAMDVWGEELTGAVRDGYMLAHNVTEAPELDRLAAHWRDPSTPSRMSAADAVTKQVGSGILPPDSEVTYEQLGYDQTTIARLVEDKRRAQAGERLTALVASAQAAQPAQAVDGVPG